MPVAPETPTSHWCRSVRAWNVRVQETYNQSSEGHSYTASHSVMGTVNGKCDPGVVVDGSYQGAVSGPVSMSDVDREAIAMTTSAKGDDVYSATLRLNGEDDSVDYELVIDGGHGVPAVTTSPNSPTPNPSSMAVPFLVGVPMRGTLPSQPAPVQGQGSEAPSGDKKVVTTGSLTWSFEPVTSSDPMADGGPLLVCSITRVKPGLYWLKRSDGSVTTELRPGMQIYRGDELRVGGQGDVELFYPDGSVVRVGPQSFLLFSHDHTGPFHTPGGGGVGVTG